MTYSLLIFSAVLRVTE